MAELAFIQRDMAEFERRARKVAVQRKEGRDRS